MAGKVTSHGKGVGMGPIGNCVCPKCGYKTPHQSGKPCRELKCPKCGISLQREGSTCQLA